MLFASRPPKTHRTRCLESIHGGATDAAVRRNSLYPSPDPSRNYETSPRSCVEFDDALWQFEPESIDFSTLRPSYGSGPCGTIRFCLPKFRPGRPPSLQMSMRNRNAARGNWEELLTRVRSGHSRWTGLASAETAASPLPELLDQSCAAYEHNAARQVSARALRKMQKDLPALARRHDSTLLAQQPSPVCYTSTLVGRKTPLGARRYQGGRMSASNCSRAERAVRSIRSALTTI